MKDLSEAMGLQRFAPPQHEPVDANMAMDMVAARGDRFADANPYGEGAHGLDDAYGDMDDGMDADDGGFSYEETARLEMGPMDDREISEELQKALSIAGGATDEYQAAVMARNRGR
jgi:hypothetical protein